MNPESPVPSPSQPGPVNPEPITPTPPATNPVTAPPTSSPTPQVPNETQQTAPKSRKKLILLLAVLLAVVMLAVVGFFAYSRFANPLKLTTYKGEHYSIKYPASYTKTDSSSGIRLAPDNSKYLGVTVSSKSVAGTSDEQRQTAISGAKDGLTQLYASAGENTQIDSKDITVNGKKALLLTIPQQPFQDEAQSGGVKHASGKIMYLVDGDTMYVVTLVAEPNSVLDKNSSKIINSFTTN